MELNLGDMYQIGLPTGNQISIEIIRLGVLDVSFLCRGEGVVNPEEEREMPLGAFLFWLKGVML